MSSCLVSGDNFQITSVNMGYVFFPDMILILREKKPENQMDPVYIHMIRFYVSQSEMFKLLLFPGNVSFYD